MIDDEIRIRLSLSRSQLKAGLTLAIVVGSVGLLHSETITLTTLYPSPSGIYRRLITTMDTFLARDGGKVTIGEKSPASLIVNGNVGIGTTNPQAALDVNGVARFGNFTDAPKPEPEKPWQDGSLYYDTTKKRFLGLQDGNWKPLGGDGIKLGESANYPAKIPTCSGITMQYDNVLGIYNGKFMIQAFGTYVYIEDPVTYTVTVTRYWDGEKFSDCVETVRVDRRYADPP